MSKPDVCADSEPLCRAAALIYVSVFTAQRNDCLCLLLPGGHNEIAERGGADVLAGTLRSGLDECRFCRLGLVTAECLLQLYLTTD